MRFFDFFRTMVPFAKNSMTNGFELIMDVEAYDYAVSSTGSEGIVLSILHQVQKAIFYWVESICTLCYVSIAVS